MKKTLLLFSALIMISGATAQEKERTKAMELYGFVMTDAGYDFKSSNPAWYDAMRVSRLPTYKGQYGPDGKTFFSVRQTRFGVKGWIPAPKTDIKTCFEFDLFGVGADEGKTTLRLRHAYAAYGKFLVGQTFSTFMDIDAFPNVVEYVGPTGMVFFRNIQIRYAPVKNDKNEVFIALERPGASADRGTASKRIELDSVKAQFQLPDLTAHYKRSGNWGSVQIAGVLRQLKWKDIHTTTPVHNTSDSKIGWGLHLSSSINISKRDVFRGTMVYGCGIENYMNDAPVDVGVVVRDYSAKPISGKPLPVTGISAYLEHTWNTVFSSALGYSSTYIENTDFASPNAYKMGQYASANLIATPLKNVLLAAELQWGRCTNFSGYQADDIKLQFSFKYNFSAAIYRDK